MPGEEPVVVLQVDLGLSSRSNTTTLAGLTHLYMATA
jgi:hypothetical protein